MAFATSQCISGYPFDDTLQHGESLSPGFDPMVVDAGPNYGPVDFPLINGYAVVDPQFGPGETMQLYYQWGLPSPPPQEFEAHQFDAMEPCMVRPQTGGFPMAPLLNVQAPLAKDPNRTVQKVKFLDASQEKLHNKQVFSLVRKVVSEEWHPPNQSPPYQAAESGEHQNQQIPV